jgi:hypothetical protein
VVDGGRTKANITICHYDNEDAEEYVYEDGVSYDSTAKKLTIVLETALENYSDFEAAEGNVNLIIDAWYLGGSEDINDLGIVSANIVAGS